MELSMYEIQLLLAFVAGLDEKIVKGLSGPDADKVKSIVYAARANCHRDGNLRRLPALSVVQRKRGEPC